MSKPQIITLQETQEELKMIFKKSSDHLRPRIKMLQLMHQSIFSIDALASGVGVSRNSIAKWKKIYKNGGIANLLEDKRGGDFRSSFDEASRVKLEAELSDPKKGFKSYIEAQAWIKTHLNIEMSYHAVNKFLKRNFGTKLKVGRKSHVNKDESAVVFFKKPI